ncbi:MAG TPA: MFS transporter [Geminicoccus sp.]|uniref:MFS transporter n=1 Tax=Geminicoccus sp. TaxID=2024832 RepID=UPI002CE87825|nr:MFS transporter [Geminicoccus sp.]HWL68705.1 MFS transporter [Geminicoccus sp.]
MSRQTSEPSTMATPDQPAWPAVISMALGVFGLVTAEFLPASLLPPIARELGITEGVAGQAVTATALVALVTSLLIATATRRLDRRLVLLAFSVLLIGSNLLVAFADGLPLLLLGRVLLGIALGGFWTMSAAVAMRLVPPALVPRALSMIFSGVSAATILAAPVGSYLGDALGWRSVFLVAAALALVTLVVQFLTLPSMAPSGATRLRTLVEVLLRPGVAAGMIAVVLVFTGHFAFFTYLRPYLEAATGAGIAAVSGILLGFGLANFAGTLLAGLFLERSLRLTLVSMPLLMAALGLGLVMLDPAPVAAFLMVALWGLAFGAVPVAWSTWVTRTVPDEAESAGGLVVAAVQLAIALGAAGGGAIFDMSGAAGVFAAASLVLLLATLLVLGKVRLRSPDASPAGQPRGKRLKPASL